MTQPVAQSVRMTLIDFRYGYIDVEALVDFLFALIRREDDAHSQDIVHLVKGHMLVLHLVPDGVGRLYAFLNLILYAHLVEGFLDRSCKLVEQFVTRLLGVSQFSFDIVVFLWVLVLETKIF